ncbi:hypothetical protein BDF21DRAFT_460324 [Thamnidium elegans]|nr:hypothetical protein BDF21DRAFT_460324 [Thamnidium elegans]
MLSRIAANQVFDFSDKSSNSQCDNLHEDTRLEFERLYRKEFSIKSAVTKKLSDIMNSSNSLQDKLSKFEKVNATNNNERAQKEIFGFILNQHVYKSSLFPHANIDIGGTYDMTKKYCSKASPLPISMDTISSSVSRTIIIGLNATDPRQYLKGDNLQRLLNTCKSIGYRQSRIDEDQTALMTTTQPNVFIFAKDVHTCSDL